MSSIFSGTGVALVTPFKQDLSIDFEKLDFLVNYQIDNTIDYIVALGTTAETPTLSFDERKSILDTIIESVNGRIPVVAGIGCNNPIEVKEQMKLFDLKKVSAILSVAPYYNRPQQRGLIAHYKSIAEESTLPILLYNVPTRTGVNLEAATTLHLAKEVPNIIGIKEASGNVAQIMEVIHNKPKDFLVISGDDALTLPLMACGTDGVISVVANAFPKEFATMVRYCLAHDFMKAKEIHYQLLDCINACFEDGNPAGVKAFLQAKSLIDDHIRLPLVQANDRTKQKIKSLLNK